MPNGPVARAGVVAVATLRGALAGWRSLGLGLLAASYPLIVVAIGAGKLSNVDLLAASESIFSVLFIPVILLMVSLVLGVGLFRGEMEDDTLVYPMSRSLPRGALVLGKYVGYVLAAIVVLLPSALVGLAVGVAMNVGPQVSLDGLLPGVLLMTVLAILAYGAFFLFLGLLTRQALVIGLIYGFLWEAFVPLLPGPLKELSLVYYLRAAGAGLVSGGPLASSSAPVSLGASVAVLVGFSGACTVLAALYVRYAEVRPGAAPA